MIKQIDKCIHGIAMLIYELRRREKDIVHNLRSIELNNKREEYKADLASSILKLEFKKTVTPVLFSTKDSKELETLTRAYRDVYKTVFTSQYEEELTLIENALIFLDKAGQETTKLLELVEYYERKNKQNSE